jgi:predicted Rdx family selenoprotein
MIIRTLAQQGFHRRRDRDLDDRVVLEQRIRGARFQCERDLGRQQQSDGNQQVAEVRHRVPPGPASTSLAKV